MKLWEAVKAEAGWLCRNRGVRWLLEDEKGIDPIIGASLISVIGGGISSMFGGKDSGPRQIPPSPEELALIQAQTDLINPQAGYLLRMLPEQEKADRYKLFLDTGDMTILSTGRTQDGSMSTA